MRNAGLMLCAGLLLSLGASPGAFAKGAKPIKVTMNKVTADGVGESIGTVTIKESKDGVTLEPSLHGLTPGEHGFHVHEKPSCDPADKEGKKTAAQAAGGHYDPEATKAHKGPGGGGHKGDLPKLVKRVRPEETLGISYRKTLELGYHLVPLLLRPQALCQGQQHLVAALPAGLVPEGLLQGGDGLGGPARVGVAAPDQ